MLIKKNGLVTFEFDIESKDKVYLAGDFNNWDPSLTPLSQKNGKWRTTLKLNPGEYQFRYCTRNSWYNDWKADKYVPNGMGANNSVVIVPYPQPKFPFFRKGSKKESKSESAN